MKNKINIKEQPCPLSLGGDNARCFEGFVIEIDRTVIPYRWKKLPCPVCNGKGKIFKKEYQK